MANKVVVVKEACLILKREWPVYATFSSSRCSFLTLAELRRCGHTVCMVDRPELPVEALCPLRNSEDEPHAAIVTDHPRAAISGSTRCSWEIHVEFERLRIIHKIRCVMAAPSSTLQGVPREIKLSMWSASAERASDESALIFFSQLAGGIRERKISASISLSLSLSPSRSLSVFMGMGSFRHAISLRMISVAE